MNKRLSLSLVLGALAAWLALRHPAALPRPALPAAPGPAVAAHAIAPSPRVGSVSVPRPGPAPAPAPPKTVEAASQLQQKLAAWQHAPDYEHYAERFQLLEEIRALINDTNAPEVARSLSDQDLAGQVGFAALQHWLAADPSAAAQWLAARGGATGEHARMVTQALLGDPQGLQAYLGSLTDEDWRKKMVAAAGSELAAQDPHQAIALAADMDSSPVQGALLSSVAQQWAASDPTSAMTWAAGTNADPGLREQLIAAVAKGAAGADPVGAADWLATSVNNPDLVRDVTQSVVRSWMTSDPAGAGDWLARFPPGPAQDEALTTLMTFWKALNTDAAAAWAAQLSAPDLRRKVQGLLSQSANAGQ